MDDALSVQVDLVEKIKRDRNGAVLDFDRVYRYALWRRADPSYLWRESDPTRFVNFIGLNPSTADEDANDPTIRKCMGYARLWGYDGIIMTNVFAYRATDPEKLYSLDERAIGPDNDACLKAVISIAAEVVCAWGNHGELYRRSTFVKSLLREQALKCLGTNQNGEPKHPLYLPYTTTREPYQ